MGQWFPLDSVAFYIEFEFKRVLFLIVWKNMFLAKGLHDIDQFELDLRSELYFQHVAKDESAIDQAGPRSSVKRNVKYYLIILEYKFV